MSTLVSAVGSSLHVFGTEFLSSQQVTSFPSKQIPYVTARREKMSVTYINGVRLNSASNTTHTQLF